MITSNMYSVNDKAIYDALNQHKVTNQDLVNIFLSRGVVISKNTPRQELANMFSRMFHDYSDYEKLASIFSVASRREKNTLSYIPAGKVDDREIIDVLKDLGSNIEDIDQAESHFVKSGGVMRLSIEYKEVNFNKSEFRQVVDKDAEIEIEKIKDEETGEDVYSIRYPLNKTCERVVGRLIEKINDGLGDGEEKVKAKELSLTGYTSPEVRSEFFLSLIDNIDKTDLYDVTYVYVYQPKEDEGWVGEEDEEDESDEEYDASSLDGSKRLGGVHITKASLNGVGVSYSEELSALKRKGFYIWKIVWKVKEKGVDSDIYELDAQFADPEKFSKFSYMVRGEYRYQEQGKYSQNRVKCSTATEKKFSKRIESAAKKLIAKVEKDNRFQGGSDETETS